MSPAQKMEIALELNRLADELALAGIAQRHPEADAHERCMRLLALKHGSELIRAAYGWSAGS